MNKKKSEKKILVPVDGSDRCFNTVRFVARFAPFKRMKIVLYNVFDAVPDAYWDLRNDPLMKDGLAHLAAWESQQRTMIKEFMQRCRTQLIMSGHDEANIRTKINKRRKGIARDIIREAHNDYDAVVTRRRGFTRVPGVLMGSVAEKLLTGLTFVPVFFVGVEMPNSRFLAAIDSSDRAMKAVRFMAGMVDGDDASVALLHTVRLKKELFGSTFGDSYIKTHASEMEATFQKARGVLVKAGVKPGAIETRILENEESRAAAIANFAAYGDYTTIFMGRQGVSRVRNFLIGRVTRKVIYAANTRTVCVV